eukprot:CAMPEP_0185175606 /NCGR_PEP_ID=MMETSP1139-20130426/27050_1 /TAXON_ID=298111 /ORGANISM="Pavlova sp., Strain CCMP459" /LENGTH=39 /DNA_ID= /DNA_START= /DNA_END= /DNA_ORIENTATION=
MMPTSRMRCSLSLSHFCIHAWQRRLSADGRIAASFDMHR